MAIKKTRRSSQNRATRINKGRGGNWLLVISLGAAFVGVIFLYVYRDKVIKKIHPSSVIEDDESRYMNYGNKRPENEPLNRGQGSRNKVQEYKARDRDYLDKIIDKK